MQPLPGTVPLPSPPASYTPVRWSDEEELADRRREADADSAAVHTPVQPFHVDRRVLRDIVREYAHAQVGRITFLSSGTFHKAYIITLVDTRLFIARVARRFMPRFKTESEIATMQYLRDRTSIPVPDVYHYDSNPYNRLGGEYILMSKATGIPLSKVYCAMSNEELKSLFTNLASIILPLFAQRFSHIGSLYFGPSPYVTPSQSSASSTAVASSSSSSSALMSSGHTPTPTHPVLKGFQFMPLLSRDTQSRATHHTTVSSVQSPDSSSLPTPSMAVSSLPSSFPAQNTYHVGPIISWPFFGSNRGFVSHPFEIDRGPWPSASAYLKSCASREINAVIAESNGRSASHRLHLDPDTIHSSRHHHLLAFPDDPESDDSDEWDAQESEEEEEDCVGANMYRDYRRMQRGTFLVAHIKRRESEVRREMGRWVNFMERLGACQGSGHALNEEFGLDCHDLSLDNIFVDEKDHTQITCVIDWESTTTRPLWACAHLPAFIESSPFTAKLFREVVMEMATDVGVVPNTSKACAPTTSISYSPHVSNSHSPNTHSLFTVASSWLHFESWGTRLRYAHRCVEWDGWEEGLVESILGPEDMEKDWFVEGCWCEATSHYPTSVSLAAAVDSPVRPTTPSAALRVHRRQAGMFILRKEREKEQMLVSAGDVCGGRGGELGRRLEEVLRRGLK
ncbi:hypothetical protein PISMIDRAFT_96398 [Pisolithus microcarpus 441]|uniref:Aminoglycoside phosphotransferase domain-containing protein n=1 Tax=Pisolithus microcarpus 441 TaxID=765257 RepID=A0A0C9ZTN6_9AGAM|nr:hypothetical protein BKA83DRAFT_96398 [Pisolithus microcarpus]KIK25622.1 hypothetical protein PISMIDRAFT_96398 [Pisolithus microcarpus 441]